MQRIYVSSTTWAQIDQPLDSFCFLTGSDHDGSCCRFWGVVARSGRPVAQKIAIGRIYQRMLVGLQGAW